MKIKTIDIQANEYWDKVNGNSYFNADISINYGMSNFIRIHIPMQYGYDYSTATRNILNELKYINTAEPLWWYCREKKIILRTNLKEGCKYKELIKQDKEFIQSKYIQTVNPLQNEANKIENFS
jgi:cytolysin (calcineurin-like family phosphatase)